MELEDIEDMEPRTWVYTQALSDGRTFVQAMHINSNGGISVAHNNLSTEAYTGQRAWWVKESLVECQAHLDSSAYVRDIEVDTSVMFANVAGMLNFTADEPPEFPPIPEL